MYAGFFGLRELPFNNTPDPRFFYSTRDHEEALASLIYAVQERKGFVLLTGEVGAGKTLVSRLMLRHFGARIAFATINHSLGTGGDLLESICTEFELPVEPGTSRTQLVRQLHDFLLAKFAQDTQVVLVLDEAQTLPVDAFEQVRMIGNLEADDAKLLQVVMLGQPELQRKFATPALRQLRQRIFRSFHLGALGRDECDGYIHHRLTVAGPSSLDIFESAAIDEIFEHSKGIPRIINTLCDNAMLSAYSADQRTIDRDFVRSVVDQMMVHGAGRSGGYGTADTAGGLGAEQPAPDAVAPAGQAVAFQSQAYSPRPTPIADPTFTNPPVQAAAPRPPDGAAVGAAYAVAGGYPATAVKEEMSGVLRDLESRIERLDRRLADVEKRVADASTVQSDIQAAHESLNPLVEQAKALAARNAAGIKDLERQEARMLRLGAKAKTVIDEVRRIFDLLKKAAIKNQRAERHAWQTFDRLVAQTESSGRLADRLDEIAGRLVSEESESPKNQSVLMKQASLPLGSRDGATSRESGGVLTLDRFQGILNTTRRSLSDLRSLARCGDSDDVDTGSRDGDGATSADSLIEQPPTQRLADEVDDLLEAVESGSKMLSQP